MLYFLYPFLACAQTGQRAASRFCAPSPLSVETRSHQKCWLPVVANGEGSSGVANSKYLKVLLLQVIIQRTASPQ